MSLPKPRPGLVISYSYLWAENHGRGVEMGVKDRPCVIAAVQQITPGPEVVTVVPVTHSPSADATEAIELPAALKAHLGLDEARSWIMVTETNDFLWPGPDLAPVPRARSRRFHYGMLPPRFFAHLRDRILLAHKQRKLRRVPRSE